MCSNTIIMPIMLYCCSQLKAVFTCNDRLRPLLKFVKGMGL